MIDPKPGDEKRLVVYDDGHGVREEGMISSWNSTGVFVRYPRKGVQHTPRERLEWSHAR